MIVTLRDSWRTMASWETNLSMPQRLQAERLSSLNRVFFYYERREMSIADLRTMKCERGELPPTEPAPIGSRAFPHAKLECFAHSSGR
jgi:hypothetical protein